MSGYPPPAPHRPVAPSYFRPLFGRILDQGIDRVLAVVGTGYPESPVHPSLTVAPFLVICLQGSMDIWYGSDGGTRRDTLAPRSAVFFAPDTWVAIRHNQDEVVRATFGEGHIHIGHRDRATADTTGDSDNPGHLFLADLAARPAPFAAELIARSTHPTRRHEHVLPQLVSLLLAELLELLDSSPESRGKAAGTWLAIDSFIREHCMEPLSGVSVARRFEINPGHLSRLATRFVGRGFRKHLEEIRLERARNLLRSSTLNVSETALACGFSSTNYFVRVFRNAVGVTPGVWRRPRPAESQPQP
ncbi:MAG: helix-turn-helix domain-containing protein [Chitinivibrionales bacterium]|nr:helix-turn-helix domain-containing protein [Chitinivibrionales bacterium]